MSGYSYIADYLDGIETIKTVDVKVGTEALKMPATIAGKINSGPDLSLLCPTMENVNVPIIESRKLNTKLILSTEDQVHFNMFFLECTDIDHPLFQNRFCRLLRTLPETSTLNLIMGNDIYGTYPIFGFGNVLDAINRAKCKVVAHITGAAGFGETAVFLMCHERHISDFGSLTFSGLKSMVEYRPEWTSYFRTIYDRAVALNLLTTEEVDSLLSADNSIYLKKDEVVQRLNRAPMEETPVAGDTPTEEIEPATDPKEANVGTDPHHDHHD